MNLRRNQDGVVLIEFAILLPLLLLLLAFFVDIGYWLFTMNRLQTAAGASAQAASYLLPDEGAARARAYEMASLNGFEGEQVQVEIESDIVTVTIRETAVLWFSAIIIKEAPTLRGRAVFAGPGGD